MQNQSIQKNTEKPLSFNHDELLKALYFIWDMMDRIPMPFVLINDTAESVINHKDLSGDGVHIGVRDTDWNGTGLNILAVLMNAEETDKHKVKYSHNGVPIYVHIYKNHPTLQSPDYVVYAHESWRVPNPYSEFLTVRNTLQ